MTKFLNISTDTTLGGSSASDEVVSSQKALKTYIDNHSGGGSVAIDEKSITKNSSDEIQTVGVIDQNSTTTAIKTWTGTKAQYDLIATKDSNTIYNITDDTDVGLDLLQTIYPVGSIYIGTMNVCPLSALFGTWTLVGSGRVLQGADANHSAGTTIEAGLPNITGNISSYTLGSNKNEYTKTGVFSKTTNGSSTSAGAGSNNCLDITFDASDSNSIYGSSTTVQPPAYVVNLWQRSA